MEKPQGLESRGDKLWDDVTSELKFDPAGYALLEDICRTADAIDRLQKALKSKHHEWVKLVDTLETDTAGNKKILVVVNPLLGEVRQQRLAMRQMWQHLRLGNVKGSENKQNFWTEMEKQFQDS